MPENRVFIRPLASIEDFKRSEDVQRDIWQMNDPTQVIPLHVLLTAQKNGGLVAGAFEGSDNGEMIGILFGFIGLTAEGKFKHCSHIAGVRPEIRRHNVGYALKLFQRSYVQKQGLDLVTWTFDPMEGVNASLNIAKLGVVTHKYFHNLYGDTMADGLNAGLPTDRFEVEWWINSQRVQEFVEGNRVRPSHSALLSQGARLINQTYLDAEGALHPGDLNLEPDQRVLLLEVPPEFQAIKTVSMELARLWRTLTGQTFDSLFANGYEVTDFITDREENRRRNFYVISAQ